MRVVLIQGLLAPYRYTIFEALAKTPGWELEVWFMGKKVKNRIWEQDALSSYKFKYSFLNGITLNFGMKDNDPFWINFGTHSLLVKTKPDVVIMMGWDSLTSFLAHLYCKILGIKFVLYSDSTPMEKSWRRFVTLPFVKLHVSKANAFIAGGTRSKSYLEKLGANPDKIFVSYNTVDVEKYKRLIRNFKKNSRQLREELGIGKKFVIMYYAQLIERKGGDLLIQAYRKLKAIHKNIFLLLIGDGPFKENLESLIRLHGIGDVEILANPGDDEVCKYYAIASVFVLPSREDVWGLVVNEAMASGLPVVVSNKAGSSADLVKDDYNGYVFKSENVDDLAKKLEKIIANEALRRKMSLSSLKHISSYDPKITVRKFLEAVENLFVNKEAKIAFLSNNKPDLISVIVPVHRNQVGLKKTVESLQNQKYVNFEIELIVEKDESGDGSYKIRNNALRKAKGEYIAFIDAGTTASPNWLKKGYEDLKKYDYIGGPIEVVREETSESPELIYLFERNREFAVNEFMQDLHFAPTTNLFVKRSVVEKLGGFDARLKSSGDLEFGERVYHFGSFSQFYDSDLVVYHPARNYSELIKKQKRLASGFVDLGRLYPDRFPQFRFNIIKSVIRALAPPLWLLWNKSWQTLSFDEKIKVFGVSYFLAFVQHNQAIRYALLHER